MTDYKRVLFKETKGRNRKVQIWAFIEPNEFETFGVIDGWQIVFKAGIIDITDGCRTFANAIDRFNNLVKNIPVDEMITQETHYCVWFYEMNDTKAYIRAYEDIREKFIDLYTRMYPDESRNTASHRYTRCAQSVIDETFAWGKENGYV